MVSLLIVLSKLKRMAEKVKGKEKDFCVVRMKKKSYHSKNIHISRKIKQKGIFTLAVDSI